MRIKIQLRRAARRSTGLFLGLVLLTAPAVVLAGHQFPDVPNGHPFHDQITAIAEAGITAGFGDGTYRPSDPVTRQAMAAFMQRGFGRVALTTGTELMSETVSVPAGASASASFVPVRQLTITVPGATNAFSPSQFVYVLGAVAFRTTFNSTNGCPCEFSAVIRDTTTNAMLGSRYQTFESASAGLFTYSFEVEALFVAPPGPRTYELAVALQSRGSTTNAASFGLSASSSLSAMTFPFGPTGTNDL